MNQKKSQIHRICFPFDGDKFGAKELLALQYTQNIDKNTQKSLIVLHKEGNFANYLKRKKIDFTLIPISTPVNIEQAFPICIIHMLKTCLPIYWFLLSKDIENVQTFNKEIAFTWAVPTMLTLRKQTFNLLQKWQNKFKYRFFASLIKHLTYATLDIKNSIPKKYIKKATRFPIGYRQHPNINTKSNRNQFLSSNKESKDVKIIGIMTRNVPLIDIQKIAATIKEETKTKTEPVLLVNTGGIDIHNNHIHDLNKKDISIVSRENAAEISNLISGLDMLINIDPKGKQSSENSISSDDDYSAYYSIIAMSAGVPVIAIDEGINTEIITDKETGALAYSKNWEQNLINAAVSIINNNDELNTMKKHSIQVFNEEFNIDNYSY
ncbi:MAG: glycosyltransferase [Alphaproteobacteria bacterium]|nr:glycosyltransferase [Alphaproteobacteria bacterium]